jgi:hypothetical protein
VLSAFSASAGDHRDAPTIDEQSAIDINDFFLFRDPPCATATWTSQNLFVALSTQAIADPKFGPTYPTERPLSLLLQYDACGDHAWHADGVDRFVFSPFDKNASCPAPEPPCQTYTATFPNGTTVDGLATRGTTDATPNDPIITTEGSISIFAGPREDPFFFDLVEFDRFIDDPIDIMLPAGSTKLAAWAVTPRSAAARWGSWARFGCR